MLTVCPVCGIEPTIIEGRYIGLITGSVLDGPTMDEPFSIETDTLTYPCGGFELTVGQPPRHLKGC